MDKLHPYYFTFGSDPNFPYQDGYIIIHARGRHEACTMFNYLFGERDGMINCAFIYDEKEWQKATPNHIYPCFAVFYAVQEVQCPRCKKFFYIPVYQEQMCPECGCTIKPLESANAGYTIKKGE